MAKPRVQAPRPSDWGGVEKQGSKDKAVEAHSSFHGQFTHIGETLEKAVHSPYTTLFVSPTHPPTWRGSLADRLQRSIRLLEC